jgi:hypothetical protein
MKIVAKILFIIIENHNQWHQFSLLIAASIVKLRHCVRFNGAAPLTLAPPPANSVRCAKLCAELSLRLDQPSLGFAWHTLQYGCIAHADSA